MTLSRTAPILIPGLYEQEFVQVDPSSELAGYSYETSHGRYVTFFWQSTSTETATKDDSQQPYYGRLGPVLSRPRYLGKTRRIINESSE